MCAVVIDGAGPDIELELRYRADGDQPRDRRAGAPRPGQPPEIHPVAVELLAMTADEFSVDGDGTTRTFRLVKQRRDSSA